MKYILRLLLTCALALAPISAQAASGATTVSALDSGSTARTFNVFSTTGAVTGNLSWMNNICDITTLTVCASVDAGHSLQVAGEGTAGSAAGGVVTVQGVASMTPILATVTGTGTFVTQSVVTQGTASNLNAAVVGTGTAGSAAGGVLTVQGVASMTPVLANPGTAANWGVGATGAAVPANAVYVGITSGGNLTGWTGAVTNGGTFAVQAAQSGTWNITNISGTVSLPTGASTSALQPTNAAQGSTTSGQTGHLIEGAVTTSAPSYTTAQTSPLSLDTSGGLRISQPTAANLNATVVQGTGSNLHVVCDSGCSSSTAPADESAFTAGSTSQSPVGGFFQTTATSNALTTGQMGAFQVTANRALFSNLRNASGTEVGTSAAEVFVGGRGTAGSAAGGVLSVQGVASGTVLPTSVTTWAGGTLGAMANYGTSPGAVLVPGVNAFVTNANTNGAASSANSAPVVLPILSHASVTALGTSLVVKASAGDLNGFNCTAITGGAAGYCIAYNGTTAPGTGALTGANVLDSCYFDTTARGCSLAHVNGSVAFSTGIVILVTSAVTPFTYTTGTDTAYVSADYQ